MNETAALWVRRQAREKLETYRSMASGRLRYEASDVARARRILPRVAELQQSGLDLIDAVKQAEQENPPLTPSSPRWRGNDEPGRDV